jgi:hypothetical protein
MKEEELKNSAVDLTELAIGVIILGIVVTVGALLLVTMRDTHLTDLSVLTKVNETAVGSNSTGANLASSWGKEVLAVTNSSDPAGLLNSANYTTTVTGEGTLNLKLVDTSLFIGQDVNVTYTYYNTTSRADWTLANESSVGLSEFGNWFKIIVIVGVAAVVLALIFMAFGNRGSSSGIGGEY